MPLDSSVPQTDDLHIATNEQMALILLPGSQDTTGVSHGESLGSSSE